MPRQHSVIPAKAGIQALRTIAPSVYILASERNGTLYTGVTSDLQRRIGQHRMDESGGFTAKYRVKSLVWFEMHTSMTEAIYREKQLKRWNPAWKLALIEKTNRTWRDLYPEILG